MKKLIPKIFLCTALASVMCISTAFAADPITVSKTGSDVAVSVTNLSPNEETTLFVVHHGTTVEDAFKDTSKVFYLDQTPADTNGTATFGFTYDGTATLDIYSGYENMGINDSPLSIELKDESDTDDDNTGEFTYGDVNNDGKITVADATAVIDKFLHGSDFIDSNTKDIYKYGIDSADVNGDGKITVADATAIIDRFLHGSDFPVEVK